MIFIVNNAATIVILRLSAFRLRKVACFLLNVQVRQIGMVGMLLADV